MANNMKMKPGKTKAYGLVRDSNGKPKIDNIEKIPRPIWEMLTSGEKQEIENVRKSPPGR